MGGGGGECARVVASQMVLGKWAWHIPKFCVSLHHGTGQSKLLVYILIPTMPIILRHKVSGLRFI